MAMLIREKETAWLGWSHHQFCYCSISCWNYMETFCDLNRHSSSCIHLLFKTWGVVLWTFAQIMSVVLKYEVSIHFTGMTKTVSLQ